MPNYIGNKVDSAGPDHHGTISPHIVILSPNSVFTKGFDIVYRDNFRIGNGLPMRDFESDGSIQELDNGNDRGWGTVEILAEDLSYFQAQRIAKQEAVSRGVPLYRQSLTECISTFIEWHPEGWQPVGKF